MGSKVFWQTWILEGKVTKRGDDARSFDQGVNTDHGGGSLQKVPVLSVEGVVLRR
jgi:hypothetical protein